MKAQKMKIERKGMASIEYVAFLPLFIILFGWLMTITSATFTQMDTEMDARRAVWENRFNPPKSMQTESILEYSKSAVALAKTPRKNPNALTQSEATRTGPSFFRDVVLKSEQQNQLVGGSWDHRQLKFQTSSQHPSLVLDKMLFQFSQFDAFDGLFLSNFLELQLGDQFTISGWAIRFVESIF